MRKTEHVGYLDGDALPEATVAHDDAMTGKRPLDVAP
jgi:hypothetical protein